MCDENQFSRLAKTVEQLHNEQPVKRERVAVLLCPPLTKRRFEKESKPEGFWEKHFGKKKEFARIQMQGYLNWEDYRDTDLQDILTLLQEINEEYQVAVIPDAKFKHFKNAILCQAFDVIFLFAHHIEPKTGDNNGKPCGRDSIEQIEFAEGGVPMEKIRKFFLELDPGFKISIVYFTCTNQVLAAHNYCMPGVGSVASVSWGIELKPGIEFAYYWIRNLDGKLTLSEAYERAIEQLYEENPWEEKPT
jgi:tellurite resistance-related uncharacterized protein